MLHILDLSLCNSALRVKILYDWRMNCMTQHEHKMIECPRKIEVVELKSRVAVCDQLVHMLVAGSGT